MWAKWGVTVSIQMLTETTAGSHSAMRLARGMSADGASRATKPPIRTYRELIPSEADQQLRPELSAPL